VQEGEREVYPGVFEGWWVWRGHRIRYQRSGDQGEAVVLVHGFGGNADHWRKVGAAWTDTLCTRHIIIIISIVEEL
jgi:hypothetical protein